MRTEIITDTIKFKIVEKSDCVKLYSLRTDSEVAKFINRDLNQNYSAIEVFIEKITSNLNEILFYKIETLPMLEFAGTICLKRIDHKEKYAEVGYELLPDFEGKGIMQNSLKEIMAIAFVDLNLKIVEAYTNKNNLKSRKFLESNNFKITDKIDDRNLENVIYRLTRASI